MVTFLGELNSGLPEAIRDKLMLAFREILLSAMGQAEAPDRHKVVEVSAVRTERTIVFYVRDPGTGFHRATLAHAAAAKATGPIAHIEQGVEMGMRPGGFATLLDNGVVDELIYSETGNEILMIKHTT
ncbi:MAG: ATP-binding protein [Candidatus Korobacteraceae bacterium]